MQQRSAGPPPPSGLRLALRAALLPPRTHPSLAATPPAPHPNHINPRRYATGWAFAFGDPSVDAATGEYEWRGNPFIGHTYFFQARLSLEFILYCA